MDPEQVSAKIKELTKTARNKQRLINQLRKVGWSAQRNDKGAQGVQAEATQFLRFDVLRESGVGGQLEAAGGGRSAGLRV